MTRCTVLCGMSRLVLAGGLSLAVEGPSKAEIVCQDNDDGTCTVTYLPTEPGLYNIVVKFDDEHILGSPFTAYIAGELGFIGSRSRLFIQSQFYFVIRFF